MIWPNRASCGKAPPSDHASYSHPPASGSKLFLDENERKIKLHNTNRNRWNPRGACHVVTMVSLSPSAWRQSLCIATSRVRASESEDRGGSMGTMFLPNEDVRIMWESLMSMRRAVAAWRVGMWQ